MKRPKPNKNLGYRTEIEGVTFDLVCAGCDEQLKGEWDCRVYPYDLRVALCAECIKREVEIQVEEEEEGKKK